MPQTHRKLLPHGDLDVESDSPKKSKAARDDGDGDVAEKKEKKNISIEETRQAIEGLSIGSHRGGNRVILIYPLEMLRSDSANTLLKSLEEPPSNICLGQMERIYCISHHLFTRQWLLCPTIHCIHPSQSGAAITS